MEEWFKSVLKRIKLSESTISMILGLMVIVVVGWLIYGYFSNINKGGELGEPGLITEELGEEGEVKLVEEDGQIVPQGLPVTHQVESGEHLWKIAERYYGSGYNWVDIVEANDLTRPNLIFVGQALKISKVAVRQPTNQIVAGANTIEGSGYKVEKGDTLWDIAVRAYQNGYQWSEIWEANKELIANPDLIEIGMELKLPR